MRSTSKQSGAVCGLAVLNQEEIIRRVGQRSHRRLFEVEENAQELAQLDDMVRYVSKHRKLEQPLEIIIMGVTHDAESKEAVNLVEQRSDSGATWWLESITPFRSGKGYEDEWPVDAMRERILQGPPLLREPHLRAG